MGTGTFAYSPDDAIQYPMRRFSLIVAFLALTGGIGCISIVARFRQMYEDFGVSLPGLTKLLLNTSGLIPGAIFIALAALLVILAASGKSRASLYVSVATLLLLIGAAVALPVALMAPLPEVIEDGAH